jgi:DDE superfamily endonuclease
LANGQRLTGQSHDYKRHGNTILFAALIVAIGEVQAGHYPRRRRVEFLHSMAVLWPPIRGGRYLSCLTISTPHKPKHDLWLARHRNVHFHFTPTHASWMNQVEIWFSILGRAALDGASFTAPKQIRKQIDAFIDSYNERTKPFSWKAAIVQQKHLGTRVSHP